VDPTPTAPGKRVAIDPHLVTYNRNPKSSVGRSEIEAGLRAAGVSVNNAWVTGFQTAMGRESSGNPNACNMNDLNNVTPAGYSKVHDYGDGYMSNGSIVKLSGQLVNFQCSRGALQDIPQTFASHHVSGTSYNIYDTTAGVAATVFYVMANYNVASDGHNLASNVQQFDPNRSPRGY
jgi:SLT domain-containing protein